MAKLAYEGKSCDRAKKRRCFMIDPSLRRRRMAQSLAASPGILKLFATLSFSRDSAWAIGAVPLHSLLCDPQAFKDGEQMPCILLGRE